MNIKLTLFLLFVSGVAVAQDQFAGEQQKVYNVVMQLFDGMRAGDSTMVKEAFLKDAQLYTAVERDGKPILQKGDLKRFLNAVGTPHDQQWDEPIWDTTVKVDGVLAQVWTEYAFYLGKTFSHCGVDAFQLFKTEEGWKIYQLTDTRRKTDCAIPESIKNSKL